MPMPDRVVSAALGWTPFFADGLDILSNHAIVFFDLGV